MPRYIYLILCFISILCAQVVSAETKRHNNAVDQAYFAQPLTPMSCDDMHPVTSKADLIRQLYGTALLNDCLYEMDIATLQDIWNIPVNDGYIRADRERGADAYANTTLNVSLNLKVNKYEKQYFPENSDAIEYVSMYKIELLNSPFTTDSRNPEDLTLFPEGYFPAAFGNPIKAEEGDGSPQAWSLYSQQKPTQYYNLRDANRDDIKQCAIYYWLSPNGQQRMVAPSYPIGAIPSMYFTQINFTTSMFGAPGKK